MAQFRYKAMNKKGEIIEATLDAQDQKQALSFIQAKKLHPFALSEVKGDLITKVEGKGKFKAIISKKGDDLLLFTRQLANLLLAGVSLGEALKVIIKILKPSLFKEVIIEINTALRGGQDFADILAQYPKYFSKSYISMIKAGEEGGFLGITCQRIVENLERKKEFKSFLISSLIYPVILSLVATLAIVLMLTYVLPRFMLIYAAYEQSLPLTTRVLLDISYFLRDYGLFLFLAVLGGIIGFYLYYQNESGKKNLDKLFLNLPFMGQMISSIAVTNITRSLGTMLKSGVPLLQALGVSRHISSNIMYKEALKQGALKVKRGGHLSEVLAESNVFPHVVIYMIGIGEETGKLADVLLQLADDFAVESKGYLKKVMKVIEPLLILIMGLIIGFIVISMLLPILGLSTNIF